MPTKVTLKKNGPIRIEGEFELIDAEGHPVDLTGKTGVSLCRCAASANMPYCDGAHKNCAAPVAPSDKA